MCLVYSITQEKFPTGNLILNVDFYMYIVH